MATLVALLIRNFLAAARPVVTPYLHPKKIVFGSLWHCKIGTRAPAAYFERFCEALFVKCQVIKYTYPSHYQCLQSLAPSNGSESDTHPHVSGYDAALAAFEESRKKLNLEHLGRFRV